MTGYSNPTGAPAYYDQMRPKCTITSSMEFKGSADNCANYKGAVRTTRCAKEGDWVEFRFASPVKCSYIKLATGYEHLHRCLIYKGHVEALR